MPAGVINPHGRIHLGETARVIERPFYGETDKQLFGKKEVKQPSDKPFAHIRSKTNRNEIKYEILRLFRKENKKKSSILIMLRDKLNFNKIEAENIYFDAMTKKVKLGNKNVKKGHKK